MDISREERTFPRRFRAPSALSLASQHTDLTIQRAPIEMMHKDFQREMERLSPFVLDQVGDPLDSLGSQHGLWPCDLQLKLGLGDCACCAEEQPLISVLDASAPWGQLTCSERTRDACCTPNPTISHASSRHNDSRNSHSRD